MSDPATVMFVDDDARVLRSLKALFRGHYKVITVDDGKDALEISKQERVHVVVSDQRMPNMLGVELLAQLKDISPNTMRLLLTGYSDVPAVLDSINKGEVFRYVTKPWEVDDITQVVEEAAQISYKLFNADKNPTNTFINREEPAPKGQHILVFEPAQDILAFIESMFGKTHSIHYANNIDRALEFFIDHPIALVITYIDDSSNNEQAEFLKQIKQNYPLATTIAVMSQVDAQIAINLINQGQIYRYLPMPISPGRMSLSVRSALNYHNKMSSNPALMSRHQVAQPKKISAVSTAVESGFLSRVSVLRKRLVERLTG